MEKKGSDVRPVLFENEQLLILDQTKLPLEEVWITPDTRESVWEAIRELRVRGAPEIGVAAAWGFYVCLRNESESDAADAEFPHASSSPVLCSRRSAGKRTDHDQYQGKKLNCQRFLY